MAQNLPQQEFLRDAMAQLNMTRDQFCARLGTTRRRLDNWLLPSGTKGYREMDEMVWKFVREILERHKEKR